MIIVICPILGPGNVSTRQAIMDDIVGAWNLFRDPGNGFWCDGLWFSDYPTPCGPSNNFYSAAGTGMGLVSEAIMTELGETVETIQFILTELLYRISDQTTGRGETGPESHQSHN